MPDSLVKRLYPDEKISCDQTETCDGPLGSYLTTPVGVCMMAWRKDVLFYEDMSHDQTKTTFAPDLSPDDLNSLWPLVDSQSCGQAPFARPSKLSL